MSIIVLENVRKKTKKKMETFKKCIELYKEESKNTSNKRSSKYDIKSLKSSHHDTKSHKSSKHAKDKQPQNMDIFWTNKKKQ